MNSKWLSVELSFVLLISLFAFAGFVSLQSSDNDLTGEQVLVGPKAPAIVVKPPTTVTTGPKPPTTTTTGGGSVFPCTGPSGEKGFLFPSKQSCPAGYTGTYASATAQCCTPAKTIVSSPSSPVITQAPSPFKTCEELGGVTCAQNGNCGTCGGVFLGPSSDCRACCGPGPTTSSSSQVLTTTPSTSAPKVPSTPLPAPQVVKQVCGDGIMSGSEPCDGDKFVSGFIDFCNRNPELFGKLKPGEKWGCDKLCNGCAPIAPPTSAPSAPQVIVVPPPMTTESLGSLCTGPKGEKGILVAALGNCLGLGHSDSISVSRTTKCCYTPTITVTPPKDGCISKGGTCSADPTCEKTKESIGYLDCPKGPCCKPKARCDSYTGSAYQGVCVRDSNYCPRSTDLDKGATPDCASGICCVQKITVTPPSSPQPPTTTLPPKVPALSISHYDESPTTTGRPPTTVPKPVCGNNKVELDSSEICDGTDLPPGMTYSTFAKYCTTKFGALMSGNKWVCNKSCNGCAQVPTTSVSVVSAVSPTLTTPPKPAPAPVEKNYDADIMGVGGSKNIDFLGPKVVTSIRGSTSYSMGKTGNYYRIAVQLWNNKGEVVYTDEYPKAPNWLGGKGTKRGITFAMTPPPGTVANKAVVQPVRVKGTASQSTRISITTKEPTDQLAVKYGPGWGQIVDDEKTLKGLV